MTDDANRLTSLPFYTLERFQDRFKWWVQNLYRLISPSDRFLPFQIVKAIKALGGVSCPIPSSVVYTGDFSADIDGWVLYDFMSLGATLTVDAGRLKISVPAGTAGRGIAITRVLTSTKYAYNNTVVAAHLDSIGAAKLYSYEFITCSELLGTGGPDIGSGYFINETCPGDTQSTNLGFTFTTDETDAVSIFLEDIIVTATPYKLYLDESVYASDFSLGVDGWELVGSSAATIAAVANELVITWNSVYAQPFSNAVAYASSNIQSLALSIVIDPASTAELMYWQLTGINSSGGSVLRDYYEYYDFAANGGVYNFTGSNTDNLVSISKIELYLIAGTDTTTNIVSIDFDTVVECVATSSDLWTEAVLVNANTAVETDVLTYANANTEVVNFADYQVAIYKAAFSMGSTMTPGFYYLRLSDGVETFYSEVFMPCDSLDDLIKVEWWRDIDIVYTGGRIVYSTGFINTMYLDGDIGKPEHSFEVEQTVRKGSKFKQSVVSLKKFNIKNLLLSEIVIDVLSRLPHHEYITILSDYTGYRVTDITIPSPDWEDEGDLAQLAIEFETDNIISTGTSVAQNYNQLLGDPDDAINIRGNSKRIFQLNDTLDRASFYVAADKSVNSEAVRIPLDELLGVEEAPADGVKYGRVDETWEDSSINIKKLDFTPQTATQQSYELGRIFYDSYTNTFTAYTDIGESSLQIGEELRIRLINDLGFTGLNGAAVSILGGVGSNIAIELLDCLNINSAARAHGLLTTTVLNGNPGYSVRFGLVRELDTSLIPAKSIIYGDPLIPGGWTATRPAAPYYPVRLGVCLVSDATLGVISVDTQAFNGTDTTVNLEGAVNGLVLNTPNIIFTVDTGVIYADVTNETHPTRKLPFVIAGVRYDLNTLTGTGIGGAARIVVPPGASTILKQTSIIYIYLNAGVPTLAVSTSTPTVPYCTIAYVAAYNAARTVTDGRIFGYRRYNNVTNRLDGIHDGSFGILQEIMWAVRNKLGSNWISGQTGTATVNNTTIRLVLSAGVGAQFRRADTPYFDGLKYLIYNTTANVATYVSSINLTDITATAAGLTLLANNSFYTIRIFYQLNSNGIGNAVIATRPLGKYTTAAEAISDPLKYNVAVNDTDIEEILYPLYDLVISRAGGAGEIITLVKLVDKRSKLASGSAGGGATGGGANDKNRVSAADTTNDYLGVKAIGTAGQIVTTILNPSANEQLAFSLADTITKIINFSVGARVDSLLSYILARGLTFGDGDTAFHESADDILKLTIGGVEAASLEATKQMFKGQAHGGYSVEAFSAAKTFDANKGNNQQMSVTASTTINITNQQPGTFILSLIISTATPPTITIGASFGTPYDNAPTLINANGDENLLTLVVKPDGTKKYSINTITA